MASPETPIPERQSVLITSVPDINEIHFHHAETGEVVYDPIRPTIGVGRLINTLAMLYVYSGPGTHSQREVTDAPGGGTSDVHRDITELSRILPSSLFRYERNRTRDRFITFGEIAIASRRPTAEEQTRYDREKEAIRLQNMQEVLDKEAEKIDLTTHDHVIIQVDDARYYMSLELPPAILSARVLDRLSQLGVEQNKISQTDVAREVWQAMPVAERSLWATTEQQIFGHRPPKFKDRVGEVLTGLMHGLGLTRRAYAVGEFFHSGRMVRVEPHITAPTHFEAGTRVIFPPGSVKGEIAEILGFRIPMETLQRTRSVWDLYNAPAGELTHTDAIEILDVIMDRQGKQALQGILEEVTDAPSLKQALDHFHQKVKTRLGEYPYYMAKQQRTIAGLRGARSVTQVGGSLPDTTKKFVISSDDIRNLAALDRQNRENPNQE